MTKRYATVILLLFLWLPGCSDDTSDAPIDQLPAATQSGAGTAGCLINGEVFLPKGSGLGGPILSAYYQQVDGEYFFYIGFKNDKEEHLRRVGVATNTIILEENNTYTLVLREDNGMYYTSNYGAYTIGGGLVDTFETTNEVIGELTITRLDPKQSIISGTFWFDAINEEGETVEIREGRFDVHYAN